MEPTSSQIGLIFKWISWKMPRQEACEAVSWLQKHATRKEASSEIARLHDLYHENKLNKETLYSGKLWEGYKND